MIKPSPIAKPDLWDKLPKPLPVIPGALLGFALSAAVTMAGLLAARVLPPQSIPLLYILVIVAGAVSLGVWTGLAAATCSFLAYNFFFIAPTYTFSISDPGDLFALFVFFGVAAAAASLAGRMREVAESARQRAHSLQALSGFAARLSGTVSAADVAAVLASEVAHLSGGHAIVLGNNVGELTVAAQAPGTEQLASADWQAAERCVRQRISIFPAVAGWQGSCYEFHPILAAQDVLGVLGLRKPEWSVAKSEDDETLQAMLQNAAVAYDRTKLEAQREAARKEAESERTRAALLSSISHDLKTPLASIQGSVSSLRQLGAQMPEETKSDLLAAIDEEAQRLTRFVTNLLDMARMDAAEPQLQRDWIDLQDIVAASVSRARRLMPSAIISLEAEPGTWLILGDAILFEHVMLNLIDNASHFSPPGKPIRVTLKQAQSHLVLAVEDQGRGIPPADLPHVFDKFFRGSQSGDVRGTGLGLTLCKRIVEGMGGSIAAHSPITEGHGTRMSLRFAKPQTADVSAVSEEARP